MVITINSYTSKTTALTLVITEKTPYQHRTRTYPQIPPNVNLSPKCKLTPFLHACLPLPFLSCFPLSLSFRPSHYIAPRLFSNWKYSHFGLPNAGILCITLTLGLHHPLLIAKSDNMNHRMTQKNLSSKGKTFKRMS